MVVGRSTRAPPSCAHVRLKRKYIGSVTSSLESAPSTYHAKDTKGEDGKMFLSLEKSADSLEESDLEVEGSEAERD